MIKNILTIGDSFTYGEELKDRYQAWPYRLGDMLGAGAVNQGLPAASNDKILRLTIESIVTEPDVDLTVIAWTNLGRSEHADEFGYYDVWPGYQGNLFKLDNSEWRNDLVSYISQYHNPQAMHKKFIQQVLMLQAFLEKRGRRYLMLNTLQNEYYKKRIFPDDQQFFSMIDQDKFMGFNKSGMAEWVGDSPKGPGGHFLDQGHRIVAEKIYDHIRHLGWIS
jgi:hypothetical protein